MDIFKKVKRGLRGKKGASSSVEASPISTSSSVQWTPCHNNSRPAQPPLQQQQQEPRQHLPPVAQLIDARHQQPQQYQHQQLQQQQQYQPAPRQAQSLGAQFVRRGIYSSSCHNYGSNGTYANVNSSNSTAAAILSPTHHSNLYANVGPGMEIYGRPPKKEKNMALSLRARAFLFYPPRILEGGERARALSVLIYSGAPRSPHHYTYILLSGFFFSPPLDLLVHAIAVPLPFPFPFPSHACSQHRREGETERGGRGEKGGIGREDDGGGDLATPAKKRRDKHLRGEMCLTGCSWQKMHRTKAYRKIGKSASP